jgi:hypothetical protein
MKREFFIVTSLLNHVGFGLGPEPCQVQGLVPNHVGSGTQGKGSKKIPSLLHEDWGFYPL